MLKGLLSRARTKLGADPTGNSGAAAAAAGPQLEPPPADSRQRARALVKIGRAHV